MLTLEHLELEHCRQPQKQVPKGGGKTRTQALKRGVVPYVVIRAQIDPRDQILDCTLHSILEKHTQIIGIGSCLGNFDLKSRSRPDLLSLELYRP